jgi:sterol desaturase/sphingolipid hydroxylase (fatty acid hydroxylase superfamily)
MLLAVVLAVLSGGATPVSWMWARYAPALLGYTQATPVHVWIAAIALYVGHGVLVQALPLPRWQPAAATLPTRRVVPRVALNLASCAALCLLPRPSTRVVTELEAAWYLGVAAAGNEAVYACVHRLLHTRRMYRFHRLHHQQRAPRALGAVYCSLVEMWVANLASFFLPLSLTNAPLQVYLLWVLSGIQTTQIHHSGKRWPWPWSLLHQPEFHDTHHRCPCRNFGNVGVLEFALRKRSVPSL